MNDRLLRYSTVFFRVTLGVTFLMAVTDRFGLWGPPGTSNVSWGNFESFLGYTALLNPYLPAAWIPAVGWLVTVAETLLGVALTAGIQTRTVAGLSSVLLLAFAFGMMMGTGTKAPFNYSVFSACAGRCCWRQQPRIRGVLMRGSDAGGTPSPFCTLPSTPTDSTEHTQGTVHPSGLVTYYTGPGGNR